MSRQDEEMPPSIAGRHLLRERLDRIKKEFDMTARSNIFDQSTVRIEPWGEGDLPLLKKLLGDPAMTEHLGGPESDEQLIKRQARFERLTESGNGRMFKIVHEAIGEAVGSVGYWDSTYHGEDIYEMGWSVLPAFQGQGIASTAVIQTLVIAQSDGKHRFLHAFPSVDNLPSNALCRKSGFTLVEECEGEYPKGNFMRVNDWRLDLSVSNEAVPALRDSQRIIDLDGKM